MTVWDRLGEPRNIDNDRVWLDPESWFHLDVGGDCCLLSHRWEKPLGLGVNDNQAIAMTVEDLLEEL